MRITKVFAEGWRPIKGATLALRRLKCLFDAHVKDKLAPYEYPKEIEFLETLPMTTIGKVQRRVLRLQEEARFKGSQG